MRCPFGLLLLSRGFSHNCLPSALQRQRRNGGPVIKNVIHTEMQDGKSLLDAHFMHAAALLKRYLCRVWQNRVNKLTSPGELMEGLCALGGLQNCGAQLVAFDEDVAKALKDISDELKVVSAKLMDCFFAGQQNQLLSQ